MKKIFIDGLGLVEGHFSGVGQYILGILKGLDELIETSIGTENKDHFPEIFVIIPRDKVDRFNSFGFKFIRYKKFPLPFRYMAALWHRGYMPPIDLWCGKGTYIFPRFVDMPLIFNKSSGLVIFDLSYALHSEYSDEGNAIFLSKMVKRSINRTNKVITISQNSKEEIVDYYKIKPDNVVVANPAADQRYFYRRDKEEIKRIKLKYGIEGDYILALSNLEPRKNLQALVEAYCALPKSLSNNTSLLLVGVSGWKTDQLFNMITDKVRDGYNIIRPSEYVSDKDKPAIISGAKMLVYPSHYEGFGMPPLEALACGTPVITSNNSSLPEVVGNCATTVTSADKTGLMNAMTHYLKNIGEITSLANIDGPKQAAKFGWVQSANIILEAVSETKE